MIFNTCFSYINQTLQSLFNANICKSDVPKIIIIKPDTVNDNIKLELKKLESGVITLAHDFKP